VDEFGLGIEVTQHNEVVGADGRLQSNLFAVGPLTRGRWFEIDAVPDIRAQCDMVALHLNLLAKRRATPQQPSFAI
jgi:uncharacterized NAD(P)/FAD-binding protein YdhS